MVFIKVTTNRRLTIPAELWETFGVKQGEFVEADVKDGALIIRRGKFVPVGKR